MKPDGGMAFPGFEYVPGHGPNIPVDLPNGTKEWAAYAPGMSLRDYFAASALQAMHGGAAEIFTASLVPPEHIPPGEHRAYVEKRITELAGAVYAIADAMLATRGKP